MDRPNRRPWRPQTAGDLTSSLALTAAAQYVTGEDAFRLSLWCDRAVLFASIRRRCGALRSETPRRERGVGSGSCRPLPTLPSRHCGPRASGASMSSLAFVELEMKAAEIVKHDRSGQPKLRRRRASDRAARRAG
jgi:hypothetical protein